MNKSKVVGNTGISVVGAAGTLVLVLLFFAGPAFAVNGQVGEIWVNRTLSGQLGKVYVYRNGSFENSQVDFDLGTSVSVGVARRTDLGTPDFTFIFDDGNQSTPLGVKTLGSQPIYWTFDNASSGNAYAQVDNAKKYFSIRSVTAVPKATVSGSVKNAANQATISSASVRLYNNGLLKKQTTSASDGSFQFTSIPEDPIQYDIFAEHPDYTGAWAGRFTVTAPSTGPIDVQLVAKQTLYNLVPVSVSPTLDANGQNVQVSVTASNFGQRNVGTFSIGIYASDNQNPSVVGELDKLGSIIVPSSGIASGQQRTVTSSWLTLADLTQGESYYIKAEIDEAPRAYPGDSASDNVKASADRITVQVPPGLTDLTLDRFRIRGQITEVDPHTYNVAGGGFINGFIYIPTGATVHTDVHSVVMHNQDLMLKPSPLTGGQSGSLAVLEGQPVLTLNAQTGTVHELATIENMTFGLGTGCAVKIKQLEIEPFAEDLEDNEISGGFQAALPLSRRAMKDAITPGIFGRVFEDEPEGWVFLDAEGGYRPTSFFGEFSISGDGIPIFKKAMTITSGGGGFDTQDRSITLSGVVEVPALRDATLSLEEFRFVDYFKPDSIHIVAELDVPIVPFPGVPLAYIFGFDKFGAEGQSLMNWASDDLKFGVEFGIMLGFIKVPVPYHGYASLKILHLDVDGSWWINTGDWEVGGSARFLIWSGFPRDFAGHELARVRCHYYNTENRFELEEGMINCFDVYLARFYLVMDTDDNTAAGTADGVLQLPPYVPFFGGLKLGEARAWSNPTPAGMDICGYARATFIQGGVGFWFGPNGDWDIGHDLYERHVQKADGAKAPLQVEVPSGQRSAAIRLSYASGETDATLTTPDAAQYDESNAAIVDGYAGPVFYRANDNVEEEGQSRREICFFLNPAQGETEVLPGTYQVELSNQGGVVDAQVELWLSNEPPAVSITEPSVPVIVNSLAPQLVHIAFEGADPVPAPEDDPDYDALQNVEIYLYYDTDQQGYDGQLVNAIATLDYVGPDPLRMNQTSYEWNTTSVPTGEYFVYAMITDGRNAPVFSDYAPGKVTITHPEAPEQPTDFAAGVVTSGIECSWTASATTVPEPTYVILYDDKPADSTERYENSLETEGQTQWIIPNLPYGRNYRVAVVAMNPDNYARSHIVGPVMVPFYATSDNNAPGITSTPVTEGRVGYPYAYQVTAEDVDGDALVYELVERSVEGHPELVSPPPGVTIDPDSGLITFRTIDPDTGLTAFTPVDGHLGANRIEVRVRDPKGGTDTQEFYVNIDNWLSPNGDPEFTSTPPTTVLVDSLFEYQASAEDPDGNQVTFALEDAPAGMTIDAGSGLIRWVTNTADAGTYPSIVIVASDGRGGTATQPMPLTVGYPTLTVDFVPPAAQMSPAEITFTANLDYPQYVTNYVWDFGDGDTVIGIDKRAVKHTFNYDLPDDGNLEDRVFSVRLRVDGHGYPDPQSIEISHNVTIRPPKPVADFSASPGWTGESPYTVTLTASCQWAFDEAGGGFTWDTDNNGVFDNGATAIITPDPPFTAGFPTMFPVVLKATGPSGETTIVRKIAVQPAAGTNITRFDHPAAGPVYWPGWHEATASDIQGESLATLENFSTTSPELGVETCDTGTALAVSDQFVLGTGGFEFSFRADFAGFSPTNSDASFGPKLTVSSSIDMAHCVRAAYMDQNDTMDVLTCSQGDHVISWWSNDGTPENGGWTQKVITSAMSGLYDADIANLDQDPQLEVLGAGVSSTTSWFDWNGTSWVPHLLSGASQSVYAVDLDGDDDIDVLASGGWWPNTDGNGTFGPMLSFAGFVCARAADLDGDTDIDVATAHYDIEGSVRWWENDGTPIDGGWTQHDIIVSGFASARWVEIADLDGDSHPDILAASQDGDKFAWWSNPSGTGAFVGPHYFDGTHDGAHTIHAADMDGDGDLDILGASIHAGTITYWENTDGQGNFGPAQTVATGFNEACYVTTADVDSDGRPDVLGAGIAADEVAWWRNLGTTCDPRAYVAFSDSRYLRLSVIGSNVLFEAVTVTGGTPSVIEHAHGSLSNAQANPTISIRYDGTGSFRVFEDNLDTGAALSWTPSATAASLGLGFANSTSYCQSIAFLEARLTVSNAAPAISFDPPLSLPLELTSGGSVVLDLNAYADDDLTDDADLEFSAAGNSLLDIRIDTVSHQLLIQAPLNVSSSFTETLQVIVTDAEENGLSASAELSVTVTPVGVNPLFTNITNEAGIDQVGATAAAALVGDLSGDGLDDLVLTGTSLNPIYVNQDDNAFSDEHASLGVDTPDGAEDAVAGDLDNDGHPDILYLYTDTVRVYLNDGTGFAPATPATLAGVGGKSCVLADVDKDGDLDLYVVRTGANTLYRNLLIGTGTLDFEVWLSSGLEDAGDGESTVFGDVDRDGLLDCFVVNADGNNNLYLQGTTGFASPVSLVAGAASYGAVLADLDNDGYPDLLVTTSGQEALYWNNGDDNEDGVWDGFVPADTVAAGLTNVADTRSVVALDYDNDGWVDIFLSNNGAGNMLYRNDGDADGNGWDGTFSDVDLDLGLVSGVRALATGAGMGASVGDIDNDGDVDIWQVNTDSQLPNLFRNNADPGVFPGRNWIQVELTGAATSASPADAWSNSSAIGARVELWKNGQCWQTREIRGGSGWRSQDSPVVYFGLGADELAEGIRVYWPSGNITERLFEAVNQRLNIIEASEPSSLVLTPARVTVKLGETVQFTAKGVHVNGYEQLVGADEVYWEVDDAALARVDGTGTVLGLTEGIAHLTGQWNGLTSLPVEVIVSDRTLTGLTVAPATAQLAVGESVSYTATALFDDASTEIMTTSVTWCNSNSAVASLGQSGIARALAEGSTSVSASYLGVDSGNVVLDVVSWPVSLAATPASKRMYREEGIRVIPFAVMKTFEGSGQPPEDVTTKVTWESTEPFVGWVNAGGDFLTSTPGETTMKAVSGSTHSNDVTLSVRDYLTFEQNLPAEPVRKYVDDDQTFEVAVTGGFEPLSYNWTWNGAPVGDDSTSLLLGPVQGGSGGAYQVTVTDSFEENVPSVVSTLQVAEHLAFAANLPESLRNYVGEDQTFEVAVTGGFEPLSYNWTWNGAPVGDDSTSLPLGPVQEDSEGAYQVTVTDNFQENVPSVVSTLQVAEHVAFATNLTESSKNYIGEDQTFEVAVTGGFEPLSFHWTWNGAPVGDDSASLPLGPVQEGSEGAYQVTVTDSFEENVPSVVSTLQVAEHVAFAANLPESSKNYIGEDQTFEVAVTGGFEPLSYNWTWNGAPVGDDSVSLPLGPVQDGSEGAYQVTVTDSFEENVPSVVSTLQVAEHLNISTGLPDTVAATYGDDVMFDIGIQGGFEPVTFQWYKDDGSKVLIPIGDNAPELMLPDVAPGDEGTYEVHVTDGNTDSQTDSTELLLTHGMPAVSVLGLGLLSGLVILGGVLVRRRRGM